jgi:hypothetical protein
VARYGLIILLLQFFYIDEVSANTPPYRCKNLNRQWEWFSDHAALYVDYIVIGQPGRSYEVGTGVSVNRAPIGTRNVYSGHTIVRAYGFGSLHIRRADDGPTVKVCASSHNLEPITILSREF